MLYIVSFFMLFIGKSSLSNYPPNYSYHQGYQNYYHPHYNNYQPNPYYSSNNYGNGSSQYYQNQNHHDNNTNHSHNDFNSHDIEEESHGYNPNADPDYDSYEEDKKTNGGRPLFSKQPSVSMHNYQGLSHRSRKKEIENQKEARENFKEQQKLYKKSIKANPHNKEALMSAQANAQSNKRQTKMDIKTLKAGDIDRNIFARAKYQHQSNKQSARYGGSENRGVFKNMLNMARDSSQEAKIQGRNRILHTAKGAAAGFMAGVAGKFSNKTKVRYDSNPSYE